MALRLGENEVNRVRAREWLQHMTEEKGVGVSEIARQIGYDRSTVSRFKSVGDSARVAEKILELKAQMELEKELAEGQKEAAAVDQDFQTSVGFIRTEDALRVLGVCKACAREKAMGVLMGPPGSGKTTALQEYLRQDPQAVYIVADVLMTSKQLIEAIARGVGAEPGGSLWDVMQRVLRILRAEPRLVIVDEADMLISSSTKSVRKLEILRLLYDQGHVGVVVCGLPRLRIWLTKGPSLRDNLAQLYSRVSILRELQGITKSEMQEILAQFNMTPAAKEHLLSQGCARDAGGIRRLTTILDRALLLAEGNVITREMIQAAEELMLR